METLGSAKASTAASGSKKTKGPHRRENKRRKFLVPNKDSYGVSKASPGLSKFSSPSSN